MFEIESFETSSGRKALQLGLKLQGDAGFRKHHPEMDIRTLLNDPAARSELLENDLDSESPERR